MLALLLDNATDMVKHIILHMDSILKQDHAWVQNIAANIDIYTLNIVRLEIYKYNDSST